VLNHGIPKHGCIDFGYNDEMIGGGGCRYGLSRWIQKRTLCPGNGIVIACYHDIPHHDEIAPID
jgi:hypothetical protein